MRPALGLDISLHGQDALSTKLSCRLVSPGSDAVGVIRVRVRVHF